MIRRLPAGVSLVCSVLVTVPLAILFVSGAACGSEPQMQTADRGSDPAPEKSANARNGERGTKAKNVPAGQDGGAKPSGSSEEAQAGAQAAVNNRPSASANREPDPNPAGSPAVAANDGLNLDSILEGGPFVIAIAAVGLVVVIAIVGVAWMLFRRKSGVVQQPARAMQGDGPWPDPVNQRPVDEPNPRSANTSQPPDFIPSQPPGRRDSGTEFAKFADEIRQLQQRVERLETLEQRVNEIDSVVASLYSVDGLTGAAKARELREPDETPGFILEQSEASLPPAIENRIQRLSFPARASECLALVRERGLKGVLAAKTMVPGTLEPAAPGPHAAFVVVDEEDSGGRYLALPNRQRLAEAQEYHTYYREYYDCASPSSGNLIVQSAAVVRESSGEWKLETRGVLSVEQ